MYRSPSVQQGNDCSSRIAQTLIAFPICREDLSDVNFLLNLLNSDIPEKIPYTPPIKSYSILADTSTDSLFIKSSSESAEDFIAAIKAFEKDAISMRRATSEEFVLKSISHITGQFWKTLSDLSRSGAVVQFSYNTVDVTGYTGHNLRPDETIYIDDFLVSKGEHQLESISTATQELIDKQVDYNTVEYGPYIRFLPVYAASKVLMKFFLLDVRMKSLHIIGNYDLDIMEQRRDAFKTSLNIFRLLLTMMPHIPSSTCPMFKKVKDITYMESYVIKDLKNSSTRAPTELYELLSRGSIPCAVQVEISPRNINKLIIRPKGIRILGRGQDILLEEIPKVVKSVLLCLQYLHHNGFVHRDIRWSNIIKVYRFTDGSISGCDFRVIDFELASFNGEIVPLQGYIFQNLIANEGDGLYKYHHDLICVGELINSFQTSKNCILSQQMISVRNILVNANEETSIGVVLGFLEDVTL
jgi:hypothetical protein